MTTASSNPYIGDAVELARYRKARDTWERSGRRGPPPVPPRSRGHEANPRRPGSTSVDYDNGRAWARKVYSEKLATGDLPQLGRGFPDELRAARGVQGIAVKKLTVGPARAGLQPVLRKMPPSQRAFWQGVLDQANDLALEVDARHGRAGNPREDMGTVLALEPGEVWIKIGSRRASDAVKRELGEMPTEYFSFWAKGHRWVVSEPQFKKIQHIRGVSKARFKASENWQRTISWISNPQTVARHRLEPRMKIRTPDFIRRDYPEVGDVLTVHAWEWEDGESELVDEHGNVFDYNVMDFPEELDLVASGNPARGTSRARLTAAEEDTLETLAAVIYEDTEGTRTFYAGDGDGRYETAPKLEKKGLATVVRTGGRGAKAWREVAITDEGIARYQTNPGRGCASNPVPAADWSAALEALQRFHTMLGGVFGDTRWHMGVTDQWSVPPRGWPPADPGTMQVVVTLEACPDAGDYDRFRSAVLDAFQRSGLSQYLYFDGTEFGGAYANGPCPERSYHFYDPRTGQSAGIPAGEEAIAAENMERQLVDSWVGRRGRNPRDEVLAW